ncbi:MAG: hypothetical protein PHC83_04105 [Bacteroidales bacterium]|nr:hypothetical protein [Bacteroidales bacterium]
MWIYKQKLIYFLIVFFFTACNKQYKGNVIYHLNDKTYIDSIMKVELDTSRYLGKTPMKSNISLYELYSRPIDETGFGHWGGITSHLFIGDSSVSIDWNANCYITFKSTFLKDKIVLYWSFEYIDGAPCEEYLKLFQKVKAKSPRKNEKFAEISLLNDTTILITYQHKEWVHKINYSELCCPEFLFPDTLHYYQTW